MGVANAYLTAVVAGAMTAGVTAANMIAVPEEVEAAQRAAAEVALAAEIDPDRRYRADDRAVDLQPATRAHTR
jgi:hypothetical protein